MQFVLVDRILELEPGSRIVAVKNLTLAEEYLADHFPGFPVLPGVLMLEAAAQAAAWLIRYTENYAHSIVILKSVRAMKYGSFVVPGRQLVIEADLTRQSETETEFKARGTVNGSSAFSGRLTMERYNLADRDAALESCDQEVVAALKRQFLLLARDWLAGSRSAAETATSVRSGAVA